MFRTLVCNAVNFAQAVIVKFWFDCFRSKSRRDFEKYLKEEAQRRTGSSNFVEPSRKSHQNGLSSKLNKNEVLYKKEAELKPLKRRSKRREGDRRTGFEQGGEIITSHIVFILSVTVL